MKKYLFLAIVTIVAILVFALPASADGIWVEWDPSHVIERNGDLLVMDAICGIIHWPDKVQWFSIKAWSAEWEWQGCESSEYCLQPWIFMPHNWFGHWTPGPGIYQVRVEAGWDLVRLSAQREIHVR